MSANHLPAVLLVDDEPLVRIVACDALSDAGFEVLEATCADDALQVLETRRDVGLLFTDVNMPGRLDGIELARLVHANWPGIKILVTSGRALPNAVPEEGRFLEKPYALGEMTEVVRQMSLAA